MYTKTITYKDFKDQERTETFSFNMTEVELIKWVSQHGRYTQDAVIDAMMRKDDSKGLVDLLDELIRESYGEVSLDGKRFVKSQEIKEGFFESKAYPILFLELASNSDEATKFFNEVFPDNLEETIRKIRERNEAELPNSGSSDNVIDMPTK